MAWQRLQISITGQVQGVGFRPCVYRIAERLQLTGWVQNNPDGVLIEIQGACAHTFLPKLEASLPPLANIKAIKTKKIPAVEEERDFHIVESILGTSRSLISADTGVCQDCLHELFDKNSRYYRYPFLNCTNCGPRFTITRQLPYDRCHTSMDDFPLCAGCSEAYSHPANRRYHAQATACIDCGPQLSSTFDEMVQIIAAGKILALKGVGGYQLLGDARNEHAVSALRQRKKRAAKPFALMVLNVNSAERLVELSEYERVALTSQSRPIVLLKKKEDTLLPNIAPGLSQLGIMLPACALHYLLFNALVGYSNGTNWLNEWQSPILIATSANRRGNPLITCDDEARLELSDIADLVVSYNRQIVTRADDSVVRVMRDSSFYIRRGRGFTPESIRLPYEIPPTLALGAHLKNTFCITRGDEAFVSQPMGSLTNRASIDFFHESLDYWQAFLGVSLEQVACDLHPDFYTTRLAHELNLPVKAVQHHHAHIAAVAAEHHILQPAIGLALDGYGYGVDSTAWGGELLLLVNKSCERLSHFYQLPQPGGEKAAREPWRMGAAVLHCLGRKEEINQRFSDKCQASRVVQLLDSNWPTGVTSSCGRLFDAASALLGINTVSSYEGQAATLLESLVTYPNVLPHGFHFENNQFNMLPTLDYLLELDPIAGANIFHGTLIAGLTEWVVSWSKKTGIQVVLLSGGCFLNKVLTEGLSACLLQQGLTVYLPQRVPPNDAGLSLGQAWLS